MRIAGSGVWLPPGNRSVARKVSTIFLNAASASPGAGVISFEMAPLELRKSFTIVIGAGLDKQTYLGWHDDKKALQIKQLQAKQTA